jgi:hypothetical protein
MSEKPERSGRRWALPVIPLVVLAVVYVGGYFLLTDSEPRARPPLRSVNQGREWLATLYEPLRAVESVARGERVLWRVSVPTTRRGHHYRVQRELHRGAP